MSNICGQCEEKYKTEKEYLSHTCKKTGFKPDTAEHLDATSGGRFSLQSVEALKRGEKREEKK